MLAQRTALLKSSGIAAACAAAEAAAANGREIIDLTAGEIWSDLAPTIREGAIAAINRNVSRYTDPIGLMELRQVLARVISAETGQPWSASQVAVTNGAKQALFNVAMAILNPGDEVLIPAPYWTTFPDQTVIAGATPIFIETRHNNFVPRLTDLEAALTSKTKAVVVNTPNNPTGAVYSRETLAGIAQLAIERDFWIIFDECYGAFTHAPHIHHSIVAVAPHARDRTLIVNSFSKSLALAGWRMGYLAGPTAIIKAVKELQSLTTSNPNAIAQHALLHHLASDDPAFRLELQGHISNARALGLSLLSSLTWVPPPRAEGGLFFYLNLSELQFRQSDYGEFIADEVADALLMEAGVATVPGTAFGDPTGIRLAYGIDLELLGRGLQDLAKTLNAWK
ncbi:aminotransferase class I/II-fold pyridoxal phosphate-dependent enzyme [Bradyrhizobium sp. CW10]|uniref:pyridoxal phosphate-dependent aminotransferase n=1 Tax=Bradyrhizobium sp. CW10 TaxID=2782683 RepID=UPI001FFAB99F|nr:aminotransferase class I/II-fold pyridoxal phosphate-dependent enzyme [Bradyrhizobium sp. CW10]MCK1465866.1 aminotransferase class I/II-fold pyridoxal phosphate-dependent enzyme [Bradyrhizobium sp. CW10]